MSSRPIKRLITRNYKNLHIENGLGLDNLDIFIGPNGSGKSNLTSVLEFLKNAIATPPDEARGQTGFDDAIYGLGGSRMLTKTIRPPARIGFEFEFGSIDNDDLDILELELLVQSAEQPVIVNKELLYAPGSRPQQPFYYYKCHDRLSGQGVVSIRENSSLSKTRFETLSDIPVNELALVTIPQLLENSEFSPESAPIYKLRRELLDTISQWRFYNANEMNLREIRHFEPKIGPMDKFLAPSGKNLVLALYNLTRDSLDFEDRFNNAIKAILPMTRRIRAIPSGRLSLTIEWYLDHVNEPLYLDEMSDGTVRMLCWAVILHSPVLPSLLVIDEPEMGIHVAWLPILAEWIKDAAQKTRVIICTHSPDLLDHFTDQVDRVAVFGLAEHDKHNFGIRRLSRSDVQEQLEQGWQLGDLYRVGAPDVGGWPW